MYANKTKYDVIETPCHPAKYKIVPVGEYNAEGVFHPYYGPVDNHTWRYFARMMDARAKIDAMGGVFGNWVPLPWDLTRQKAI